MKEFPYRMRAAMNVPTATRAVIAALLWFSCCGLFASAQSVGGQWIVPPGTKLGSAGVYDFRKTVTLPNVPKSAMIHVSADNRFILYVNGQRIGDGPARGDLAHWRYASFDISSALHVGTNVIAARVWSFGSLAPYAQMWLRPAFLLWEEDGKTAAWNTDASWQVREEKAWTYTTTAPRMKWQVGPNEAVDANAYDWKWNTGEDYGVAWTSPEVLEGPAISTNMGPATATDWKLMRDPLPAMEYSRRSAGDIVRGEGDGPHTAPKPIAGTTIPANTHVSFLLDRASEMTGYPMLTVSGGTGAHLRMTYTEALFEKNGLKGNRDDIAGKTVDPGFLHDDFTTDGAPGRTFEPLWWRTWRYMQVDVQTGAQPVTIDSLTAMYSAYPFVQRAKFASSDTTLTNIFDIGWRTLRLNAHETFMDCPFWEQMQYIGDARIEALVSYAVGGDDRVGQQAMWAFDDSAVKEGITQSRYPSEKPQLIPPFSMLWIGMLHDAWWYRPDAGIQKASLPLVRSTLEYFARRQRDDGLLGRLPTTGGYALWFFLDWADEFKIGVPPQDADGGSIPLSLQFAQALRDAADLEDVYGDKARAVDDRAKAAKITAAAYAEGWDASRGILADTPAKLRFSQQTNILGVMTDAIPPAQQKGALNVILKDELAGKAIYPPADGIVPASYYFRFYLARAVDHAGMDDLYLKLLGPWQTMLQQGLTTTAEKPDTKTEDSRSDAHAWASHPDFDLLTLVAGIRPASAGFQSVTIAPHLGDLKSLKAKMPIPKGMVDVSYATTANGLKADITLPQGTSGTFVWKGNTMPLHAGMQTLKVKPLHEMAEK